VNATDAVLPTVSGSIVRPGAGVRLDAHGHAWIAPPALAVEEVPALRDEPRLVAGLERFAHAAAPRRAALLDCQAPGCGRDAAALARIAKKSGVAIAALTGFHLRRAYPKGLRPWTTTDGALSTFIRELEGGFREVPMAKAAGVKAAFTGAVEDDDPCWEAAIAACKETGALLVVHTEDGAGIEDLVEWLQARGLPPERAYLLDADGRADAGLLSELASAGALLGFASSLRPTVRDDGEPFALLQRLLEEGLARSVAVGLDLGSPALWGSGDDGARVDGAEGAGAPGPAALVTVVEAQLRELGVAEDDVDALLGASLLERAARPEVRGAASRA
jgi:predicted metal-dependent phosphotriesterase family hydrolase